MATNLIAAIALVGILLSARSAMQAAPQIPQSAEELVQALGQFPAAIPATGASSPLEQHRREIYDQLWSLGPTAVAALCRGLGDPHVQVRRNVALFLGVAGNDWYDRGRPRLAIAPCAPALVGALGDSDGRVRELAAQAVPATGAAGASAVPALIRLLGSASEGDRNTACIALAGIGPAAAEASPALRKALADPSATVRSFAKRAIERIERAQDQLLPFRDTTQGRWGYKRSDGSVTIPPRYLGAGVFRDGHAPVKDSDGFAVIDDTGRIVERIVVDSVSFSGAPVPPPADKCAWSASAPFPSIGLQCYARQLGGSAPVVGGEITIGPPGGESARSAVVLKFPTGVVVVEDIGYEGFTRRVLLPGVTAQQAIEWRLKLYANLPMKEGCSESWSTGTVPGGAFIEQVAGC